MVGRDESDRLSAYDVQTSAMLSAVNSQKAKQRGNSQTPEEQEILPVVSASLPRILPEHTTDRASHCRIVTGTLIFVVFVFFMIAVGRYVDERLHPEDYGFEMLTSDKRVAKAQPTNNASLVLTLNHTYGPDVTILDFKNTSTQSKVYIIGTNHFLKSSKELSQKILKDVNPDAVFLEMCTERRYLVELTAKDIQHYQSVMQRWPAEVEYFGSFSYQMLEGKTLQYVINLGNSEDKRLLFESYPNRTSEFNGGIGDNNEFSMAYQYCKKAKCSMVYGDRPWSITMERAFRPLALTQKIVLSEQFLQAERRAGLISKLFDEDYSQTLLDKLSRRVPHFHKVIYTERNLYLTAQLERITHEYSTIVALVGKAHYGAIVELFQSGEFEETTAHDLQHLETVPEHNEWSRIHQATFYKAMCDSWAALLKCQFTNFADAFNMHELFSFRSARSL